MKKTLLRVLILIMAALLTLTLAGCGSETSAAPAETAAETEAQTGTQDAPAETAEEPAAEAEETTGSPSEAPAIDGLKFDHAMELEDAECFDIYYYSDGYKLIDVHDSAQYLLIPEGKEAPEIAQACREMAERVDASFIIDT